MKLALLPLPTHDAGLALPAYESAGAAGMDLRACLPVDDRRHGLALPPAGILVVPTGLAMAVPEGFEAQVRPRSGLAAKHGITVINSPGTIDADYRGEVQVALVNHGPELFHVMHGARIAQLVIAPVARAEVVAVAALPDTPRGTGGFGSTGVE